MSDKIKFFVSDSWRNLKSHENQRPFLGLIPKAWNDFGNYTAYTLYYYPDDSNQEYQIGQLKIMQTGASRTTLQPSFPRLDEDEISLGQDLTYYNNLRKFLGDKGADVLIALNDIAWRRPLAEQFEHETVFINSLIRSNEAKSAIQFGRNAFLGRKVPDNYSFTYIYIEPNSATTTEVAFDFQKMKHIPWRICALIGKNGVGKTQILSSLALSLVQGQEIKEDKISRSAFSSAMPIFSRVIALSFSAFDQFARPKKNEYVSYFYCGAMNSSGKASESDMQRRFTGYQRKIKLLDRTSEFAKILIEIMNGPDAVPDVINPDDADVIIDNFNVNKVSSGQGIACFAMAGILSKITSNSLILFDEPELHLHPNAVASLMQILHRLMDVYTSFAILATHSPLVVREIPKRNVVKMERIGSLVTASNLPKESLGEDVSELTRQIFETTSIRSIYMDILARMAQDYTFNEVLDEFDNDLSINATAFLAAQYQKNSRKNK